MSASRERFEAWAKDKPREFDLDIQTDISAWPGQYDDYITQCAWEGWQAATAAAEADLTQSVQMYIDAALERDEAIAAEIKAEQDKCAAVRRCAELVLQNATGHGATWRTAQEEAADRIKAEFPEAWK